MRGRSSRKTNQASATGSWIVAGFLATELPRGIKTARPFDAAGADLVEAYRASHNEGPHLTIADRELGSFVGLEFSTPRVRVFFESLFKSLSHKPLLI